MTTSELQQYGLILSTPLIILLIFIIYKIIKRDLAFYKKKQANNKKEIEEYKKWHEKNKLEWIWLLFGVLLIFVFSCMGMPTWAVCVLSSFIATLLIRILFTKKHNKKAKDNHKPGSERNTESIKSTNDKPTKKSGKMDNYNKFEDYPGYHR